MAQPTKLPLKAVTPEHLIVSAITTALVAALDGGFQYVQSNGAHFSIVQLAGVILIALLSTLGTGVISLEKNPTIQQSIDGALLPSVQQLSQLASQHINALNQLGNVINYLTDFVQQQSVQATPQPPVQAAQPVAQVAFPANVNSGSGLSASATLTTPPLQGVAPLTRNWTGLVPTPPRG